VDGGGLLVGGCGIFFSQAPAMEDPDATYEDGGFEGQAEEGVCPAAMVLEGCDGAANGP